MLAGMLYGKDIDNFEIVYLGFRYSDLGFLLCGLSTTDWTLWTLLSFTMDYFFILIFIYGLSTMDYFP